MSRVQPVTKLGTGLSGSEYLMRAKKPLIIDSASSITATTLANASSAIGSFIAYFGALKTKAQRAAGIKNEELAWRSRHHALFVGYAPLKNPRYVCSVVVEHGVGGSLTAAPIAKDLLLEAQRRNPAETTIQAELAVKSDGANSNIKRAQN